MHETRDHTEGHHTFRVRQHPVPSLPSSIAPIWDPFTAPLPDLKATHPLGCHRPCIADRMVVATLVQVLVVGRADERVADAACSPTTRRRVAWSARGVMDRLRAIMLGADDRMIGLQLGRLAVAGCITKASCGGKVAHRSPVDQRSRHENVPLGASSKRTPLLRSGGSLQVDAGADRCFAQPSHR